MCYMVIVVCIVVYYGVVVVFVVCVIGFLCEGEYVIGVCMCDE